MAADTAPGTARKRTVTRQRLVSPDLARGITLLGIAMANVVTAWVVNDAELASSYGGVYDNSVLDKITVVLGTMFVHVRGLPMFATLLGLGVGMIVMSLWRRGYPVRSTRWTLVRRYGLLAIFGAVHMVFLFFGDIMVFYGLAGMFMAVLITLRDKILLWIAGVILALAILATTATGMLTALVPGMNELFGGGAEGVTGPGGFTDPATYGDNLLLGLIILVSGIFTFPLQALMFLPLIILGFVAARRGILTDTRAHRKLLVVWVWVGVAVIVVIGLPWGLSEIGVLPTTLAPAFQMINSGLGLLTGPAIVAAIALLSQPLQDRINRERAAGDSPKLPFLVRAMTALGKRSMTGYVLQSVFFIILVRPFGLGLGAEQGAFVASLIGLGVWMATVAIALGLDYAGKPGPLEYLHRLLAYGRGGLQGRWQPKESRQVGAAAPAGDGIGEGAEAPGLERPSGPTDHGAGGSGQPRQPAPPLDSAHRAAANPYRGAALSPGDEGPDVVARPAAERNDSAQFGSAPQPETTKQVDTGGEQGGTR